MKEIGWLKICPFTSSCLHFHRQERSRVRFTDNHDDEEDDDNDVAAGTSAGWQPRGRGRLSDKELRKMPLQRRSKYMAVRRPSVYPSVFVCVDVSLCFRCMYLSARPYLHMSLPVYLFVCLCMFVCVCLSVCICQYVRICPYCLIAYVRVSVFESVCSSALSSDAWSLDSGAKTTIATAAAAATKIIKSITIIIITMIIKHRHHIFVY